MTVGAVRDRMEATGQIDQSKTRTGADGRTTRAAKMSAKTSKPKKTKSQRAPKPVSVSQQTRPAGSVTLEELVTKTQAEFMLGQISRFAKICFEHNPDEIAENADDSLLNDVGDHLRIIDSWLKAFCDAAQRRVEAQPAEAAS